MHVWVIVLFQTADCVCPFVIGQRSSFCWGLVIVRTGMSHQPRSNRDHRDRNGDHRDRNGDHRDGDHRHHRDPHEGRRSSPDRFGLLPLSSSDRAIHVNAVWHYVVCVCMCVPGPPLDHHTTPERPRPLLNTRGMSHEWSTLSPNAQTFAPGEVSVCLWGGSALWLMGWIWVSLSA